LGSSHVYVFLAIADALLVVVNEAPKLLAGMVGTLASNSTTGGWPICAPAKAHWPFCVGVLLWQRETSSSEAFRLNLISVALVVRRVGKVCQCGVFAGRRRRKETCTLL